jgi:hypothetical protein
MVKWGRNRRLAEALIFTFICKRVAAMRTYDAEKSTNEVRQGSGRLMNFRVLIWSLLGIILAFGLIYLVFYAMAPPPNTTTGV